MAMRWLRWPLKVMDAIRAVDFLSPLALRLYLVPVFWMAGSQKFMHFQNAVAWFGNPDWGLGLSYPTILAAIATATELFGTVSLLFGFAVRWMAIPMMFVMVVAATSVHWEHGWYAIAPGGHESAMRLKEFLAWLEQSYPTRHSYITELGKPVILNNGIEFAATYFIMLLSLFFTGAGRYVSVDYWLSRYIEPKILRG